MIGVLKYGTTTSQIFWGCDESDTGGVLGVFVDGVLYTGDTLASTNDYTGIVEVTGLQPGQHTWQMSLDGVGDGNVYTFRTLPDNKETFSFVIAADATGDCQGFSTVANENARFGIMNGDNYYLDVDPNFSDKCTCGTLPEGAEAVVLSTVLTTYRCKHRCHLSNGPLRAKSLRSHQWDLSWHNHEFEVQPFQTTNDPGSGIKYQAAKQAADEYMFAGNAAGPTNYDSYPDPIVYRDYYIGNCHFIHIDHTSYGMVNATAFSLFEGTVPDGAGGTNTGSQQLDWVADTIGSSTGDVIFLVTPAEPVHTSGNGTAGAQWDTLLDAVDASDKTIINLCADTHGMMAQLIGGTKLPTRPMLCVNMSPLEHPLRSTSTTAWGSDATLYILDQTEPPGDGTIEAGYNYNYGVIKIVRDGSGKSSNPHVDLAIKNALTGAVRWGCTVDIGSNTPVLYNDKPAGSVR